MENERHETLVIRLLISRSYRQHAVPEEMRRSANTLPANQPLSEIVTAEALAFIAYLPFPLRLN